MSQPVDPSQLIKPATSNEPGLVAFWKFDDAATLSRSRNNDDARVDGCGSSWHSLPVAKTIRTRTPRITGVVETPIAAIDVGANAVRLEIARGFPDGSIEIVHQERDPVRPAEGLFQTGVIPPVVVDRLVGVLRRYAIICRRHHARVRAVGTSALREAKNRDEVIRKVKSDTGLLLEAISGKEEARLMCLGILSARAPKARSLCLDIGGGSTEVAGAIGETPTKLWSVAIGTIRLTDIFKSHGEISAKQLKLMREFAHEAVADSLPPGIRGFPRTALGSSGSIRAIIGLAAAEGTAHATTAQITHAVEKLARMGSEERQKRLDPKRADILVAGAVILEALAKHLSLRTVTAVDRGLRHGVLVDLVRRRFRDDDDTSLLDAACALGRRFFFDEAHALQVTKIALAMFDQLAALHRMPMAVRPYLEVAAALHDLGHAVSYQKHHRHSEYLIRNGDIPGLADREREIVARIARFHRRSEPDLHHPGMEGLSSSEARNVRKLATLLRVADALDRSHAQPVTKVRATVVRNQALLQLTTHGPADLELWDVAHEAQLFRRAIGKGLVVETAGSRRTAPNGREKRNRIVT